MLCAAGLQIGQRQRGQVAEVCVRRQRVKATRLTSLNSARNRVVDYLRHYADPNLLDDIHNGETTDATCNAALRTLREAFFASAAVKSAQEVIDMFCGE